MRMMDKGELSYVMEPTYMHCFYPLKKSETVLNPSHFSTPDLNVKSLRRSPTAKMYSYIGL